MILLLEGIGQRQNWKSRYASEFDKEVRIVLQGKTEVEKVSQAMPY